MQYYYAVFEVGEEGFTEVYFPDIPGCATFGKDWDEAFRMATDALAASLAGLDKKPTASPREKIKSQTNGGDVVPVILDSRIMRSYEKSVRVNISLPESLLREIDSYRGRHGKTRSGLLAEAVSTYLEENAQA
ncbi:type II toxin-antitoxin system HicB family antitoxin [Desulfobotulus sp. H1]|uniref:Type II toxin-antitoxin system HicB family antitoxin n=1 Tax=Desulfobotulus pelophilus TaxID=2823377 RepID=A0ABT3N5I2_9BACT|nr:type II toxin-antitoxin system HicB family antitoxin [Desulfobotulus pelophilus]MCW7752726.1 type II toxin-antitoxin system HicB family antitoxin [Desulfobotulus pelophilus]